MPPYAAKDKPVLLTGATGFVGSYALRALWAAGYRTLHATKRARSNMALIPAEIAEGVVWHDADLEDYFSLEEALAGIHTVVHCAAIVSFRSGDAKAMQQTNVAGTRNVVDAALAQGVQRIIHLSSVAALGRKSGAETLNELDFKNDEPRGTSYGRSKYLAEMEVWRAQAEGLRATVLYPSVVLGAGFWQQGTGRFFEHAERGMAFYPSGSSGWVDVRDVAQAIVRACDLDEEAGQYLISAANVDYKTVVTQMAQALNAAPPTRLLPKALARLLVFTEAIRAKLTGSTPFINKDTAYNSYQRFAYDASHSIQALGMEYRSLATTIRETAQCYRDTKAKGWGVLDS